MIFFTLVFYAWKLFKDLFREERLSVEFRRELRRDVFVKGIG